MTMWWLNLSKPTNNSESADEMLNQVQHDNDDDGKKIETLKNAYDLKDYRGKPDNDTNIERHSETSSESADKKQDSGEGENS